MWAFGIQLTTTSAREVRKMRPSCRTVEARRPSWPTLPAIGPGSRNTTCQITSSGACSRSCRSVCSAPPRSVATGMTTAARSWSMRLAGHTHAGRLGHVGDLIGRELVAPAIERSALDLDGRERRVEAEVDAELVHQAVRIPAEVLIA